MPTRSIAPTRGPIPAEEATPVEGPIPVEEAHEAADWSVYLLISSSSSRTYVGIALDTARRLSQHNGLLRGGARSTRAGRPWELAASFGPYRSRALAQRAEAELKRRSGIARLDWDGSLLEP